MPRLLLIALSLFLAGSLPAQLGPAMRARIDSLFSPWNRTDSPGCALAVVHKGELIYKKGYGMADLEHGAPIDPQTVFYAGSVSKQFVAFCILLLEEEGKLNLEDDIRKHVQELPDYGRHISIRHLVHHTSGLRDYLHLWELSGRSYLDHIPKEAALDLICRQEELNFPPGERYSYSNSGYFLLGLIIERISGKSLREYAHERIFAPLGMERSHFHDDLFQLIPDRAFGYQPGEEDGTFQNLFMRFDLVGSGGLYTTVEDLYKWDQNFYRNRLGKGRQELIEAMHVSGALSSGEKTGYAFAQVIGQYRGLLTVSHTGSLGGYRALYQRFPEQEFSVIILSNLTSLDRQGAAEAIADLFLEDFYSEEEEIPGKAGTAPVFYGSSEEDVKDSIGRYYSRELDAWCRIYQKENGYFARIGYGPERPLEEWREGDFFVIFIKNKKGKIEGLSIGEGALKNIRFLKVEQSGY
jgi:CubicO group peptidase (beta-lactamase class C family)